MSSKVIFLMSHPIQYYSPLFEYLSKDNAIDVKVYYCSDYGVTGKTKYHPRLGLMNSWDTDLLKGYDHIFLKNYSFYSSIFKGFFGAVNFGLYNRLKKDRPDLLVVYGWNYFTMVFAIICAKLLKIKIALRGDNSLETESHIAGFKLFLKKLILGGMLFKNVEYILYVGESNKDFFLKYRTPISKLWFLPHAVDNHFFNTRFRELSDNRLENKTENQKFKILFVGRLVPQKRPLDLIKAVKDFSDVKLTIIGMGPLSEPISEFLLVNEIENVELVGFKNQTELPFFFAGADLFVLPSGKGETWGLVVNEAMNFGLPVIVSDTTGCARDLVKGNGYVFKTGEVAELRTKISEIKDDLPGRVAMSKRSLEIIDHYSYHTVFNQLKKLMLDK